MFVTTLDDLPEALRDQFVESEFEGKQGFQHKDTVALKNALVNAKAEKEQLRGKVGEFEQRLSQFEEAKAAEIEAARAKALEEAINKGDVKAIEERYKQQMADLEKQVEARTRETVGKEFQAERAKERKKTLIAELSALGVDSDAQEAMRYLLEPHIDIDPETGKEFLLDSAGGALNVEKSGFEAEIRKMSKFRRLIAAQTPTQGTGAANGSSGGGATQRKFSDYSGAELSAIRKQNPAEYERLRAEHYN